MNALLPILSVWFYVLGALVMGLWVHGENRSAPNEPQASVITMALLWPMVAWVLIMLAVANRMFRRGWL